MIRKLSNREKVIAALTLVMGCVFIMVYWVIRPLGGMLTNIDSSIEASRERLAKARTILERDGKVSLSLEKLMEQWAGGSSESSEGADLIDALASAAATEKIRIINIEPRPVIKDVLTRYPIAVTFSGSSSSVIKFLHTIQSKPMQLNVDSLNLERVSEGTGIISGSLVVTRLKVTR